MNRKRNVFYVILTLVIVLVLASPVFAYTYRAPLTVVESNGTDYTMLPVSVSSNNDWMASNGFMKATALDTRVETLGGLAKPHMVVDDRTLSAIAVPADSQTNLYFSTGNSDLTSMDIIPGYGGYIKTDDAAALELGTDGEIEFDGYVDTTNTPDRPLVWKKDSFVTLVDGASQITSGLISAEDYEIAFTKDGTWQTIDLSPYFDDDMDVTGVILEVHQAAGTQTSIAFRKNGSTDDRYYLATHTWAVVGLDSDSKFQARASAAINVYARGFTDSSWTFATNAPDISLGAFGAWTNIDVSASAPDAVGVIVEMVNKDAGNNRRGNVRKDGSTDARINNIIINNHTWAIMGVSAVQILEGYAETADVDFYLIGYVTSGATFATDATDKSLAGVGAWTDIDCSAQAPDATFLFFENVLGTGVAYGYRQNGSTEALNQEADSEKTYSIVSCDGSQVVEGYIENVTNDFFLVGYATSGITLPIPDFTYTSYVTATAISSGEHTITTQLVDDVALSFDGNDSIDCGNDLSLDLVGNFTIEAWVNPTGATPRTIIARANDAYMLQIGSFGAPDEQELCLYVRGGWRRSGYDITNGVWSHIAVVYDGANCVFYENGLVVATIATAGAYGAGANNTYIGLQAPANNYFTGELADVRIYQDDLTLAAIQYSYNAGRPQSLVDLDGWWRLIEGSGTSVHDDSGTGNDGTITGATWDAVGIERFSIYVDSVREDSAVGDTLVVTDNGNDWYIDINNVLPYMDYYKHTVGGFLIAWYQPVTMIIGTTLPDRQGAAQNGTFFFGTNPSGVVATLGSMVSSSQPVPGTTADEPPQDMLPDTEVTDWYIEPDVTGALLTNPVRPFVTILSDTTTLTELQAWRILGLAFILFCTVLTASAVRGHHAITGFAAGGSIGACVVMTVFPLWSLVFAIGAVIGGLIAERSPSL